VCGVRSSVVLEHGTITCNSKMRGRAAVEQPRTPFCTPLLPRCKPQPRQFFSGRVRRKVAVYVAACARSTPIFQLVISPPPPSPLMARSSLCCLDFVLADSAKRVSDHQNNFIGHHFEPEIPLQRLLQSIGRPQRHPQELLVPASTCDKK
jgi:hypothetical protein